MDKKYTVTLTEHELRYIIAAINIYKFEGNHNTYGQFGDDIKKNLVEQTRESIEFPWAYDQKEES